MPFVPPPLAPNLDAAFRDVEARAPEARAAALEVLAEVSDGDRGRALAAIRPLVADEAAVVRVAALVALGRLRDEPSIERVLERLGDEDPTVREIALIAASEIGGERAEDAAIEALRDARPEVRFQAVAAIARLAPERARGHVVARLEDDDPKVRAQAVEALASLGDLPGSREALAARLGDPDAEVRAESALALGALGDRAAVPELARMLEHPERAIAAAEALGALDPPPPVRETLARIARAFLRPLLVKAAASASLAQLGDPRGVEGLRAVMRALRADGRSYAVAAIGEQRIAALAPEVIALVERPRGVDLATVAEALARLVESSTDARIALERLARRDDEAGAVARERLASLDAGAPA